MRKIKHKKIISVTIDSDLHSWLREHTDNKRKSISGFINEYILELSSSINKEESSSNMLKE